MLDSLRTTIGRALGLAAKKGSEQPSGTAYGRAIPAWMAAAPLTPTQEFRTLMDKGYRRNVVVYICINEIASSVAQPKLVARRPDGKELDRNEPLARLIRRPNPEQPKFAFLEGLVTNLQSAGNAYVHKLRNSMGMPVQIWNLRPDRMKVKPNADGSLDYYEYTVETKQFKIPANDVIHFKLHDPLDDYYGLSPVAVAGRILDLDDQALDYLRAFFTNGAAPAGILKLKEQAEPEERERIKRMWKELYGSQRGWHELAVLDASVEYEEIGSRPEKLRMGDLWGVTESRLCAVWGVPPILVQVASGIQASTFSNYREAVKAFWSETLVPMYTRLAEQLTFGLAADFSGDLEMDFDLAKVEVLQEGQVERRTFALSAWAGGLAKLNEAREMAGLEPVDGPDGEAFKAPPPNPFGAPPPGGEKEEPEEPETPGKKKTPPPPPDEDEEDDDEEDDDDAAPKEEAAAKRPFSAARLIRGPRPSR